MKLYMHPVSMTCRPVRLFAADNNIAMDEEFIDLMTGAHMQPPYSAINPNCLVPMLEDDDLRLTESSAILKYLADKIGSPTYPRRESKSSLVNVRGTAPALDVSNFAGSRSLLRERPIPTMSLRTVRTVWAAARQSPKSLRFAEAERAQRDARTYEGGHLPLSALSALSATWPAVGNGHAARGSRGQILRPA